MPVNKYNYILLWLFFSDLKRSTLPELPSRGTTPARMSSRGGASVTSISSIDEDPRLVGGDLPLIDAYSETSIHLPAIIVFMKGPPGAGVENCYPLPVFTFLFSLYLAIKSASTDRFMSCPRNHVISIMSCQSCQFIWKMCFATNN